MESRTLTFVLLAMVLLNAMMKSSGSPLPDEGYTSEDIDEAIQMMSELPVKRGMCRSGFTYSAILRYCVPSMGALRGRNGRRRY